MNVQTLRCARAACVSVAMLASSAACWSCGSGLPVSKLTLGERETLAAATRFDQLFADVRHVRFAGDDTQPLSARPLLKAIDREGRFVVLDKLNVRKIYLFTAQGEPAGEIGHEGRGDDRYIYPHTLAYDPGDDVVHVYDGDLMRFQHFSGDGRFLGVERVALKLDQVLLGPRESGTMYGYSSRMAYNTGPGDVVHVLDDDGDVVRHFAPQSAAFTRLGASEGGGIAWAGDTLYVATPYELTLRAFTPRGRLLGRLEATSPHYTPPPPPPEPTMDTDAFDVQRHYHQQWSHVRQILSFDDRLVGLVFAEAGERRVFLSLFDLDLTPLTEVELPPYLGDLLAQGDRLFVVSPDRRTDDGSIRNPDVTEFRLQMKGEAR